MSRKLVILYGSQTGTAQEVSESIWRESKKHLFSGGVMAMDDFDVKNLIDQEFVLFVCSTTGQGDEPDNMQNFWKFLLRKNLTSALGKLNFGVIGLGDSSYSKFNFVAKRLFKRLIQLGASPILPVALCDEMHELGMSAVLLPWMKDFWQKLDTLRPVPTNANLLNLVTVRTRWTAKICNTLVPVDENHDIYDDFEETTADGRLEVVENHRTTSSDHFQDVRLISFCRCNLIWNVGDVAYIRPKNSPESVQMLFELFDEHKLKFKATDCVVLEPIDEEMQPPKLLAHPVSLKTIATQFWDLNAVPRARSFEVLSYNCENELEKEKLEEFSNFEDQQELLSYANRPRRTILEVMQDFPHATSKLTLDYLFELFQPIKPRPFSIASSMLSGRLDLLVAVVEYKTRLKATRKGLCSNWMKTLQQGDRVRITIKKGTFKFPQEISAPIIMVGPGTGLAIFRSILQDYKLNGGHINRDKMILFFGCRNENKDFHCRDELLKMEREGIVKIFCAFSRDQKEKIYVQHLIRRERKILKNLILERGGHFYISGSSKDMPSSVREALEDVLEDKEFVEQMVKSGKYQEETWG